MKSLTQYLAETKKKYSFKIWLACEVDKECCDKIRACLDSLEVDTFSAPKRLPIQRNNTYFPHMGATEITTLDVTVNYPATPPEVQSKIEACGIPSGCVVVQTALQGVGNVPSEQSMGKSILQDPSLAADPIKGLKTDEQIEELIKELQSMAMTYAAPNKEKAKTTNDLPQGKHSVMGHRTPTLPTAKSIKK